MFLTSLLDRIVVSIFEMIPFRARMMIQEVVGRVERESRRHGRGSDRLALDRDRCAERGLSGRVRRLGGADLVLFGLLRLVRDREFGVPWTGRKFRMLKNEVWMLEIGIGERCQGRRRHDQRAGVVCGVVLFEVGIVSMGFSCKSQCRIVILVSVR